MIDKLAYLVEFLLDEMPEYRESAKEFGDQRMLLRALMNVRPPMKLSPEFLKVQDEFLSAERERRGVVDVETLPEVEKGISL